LKMAGVHIISHNSLIPDRNVPAYYMGSFSTMHSSYWNMTRVSVREGEERLLARERDIIASIVHPSLMLLMGQCLPTETDNLKLVFEPVMLGSLYFYLHSQEKQELISDLHGVDLMLQVTEGLVFLAEKGLVRRAVTSHAVQLTRRGIAKLGQLELTVSEGECVGRPPDKGRQSLYNWLNPEVMLSEEGRARQESDVYSLCCVIWELFTGEVPWGDMRATEIVSLVTIGISFNLNVEKLSTLICRMLIRGLQWDLECRELKLLDVRETLLVIKAEQEEDSSNYMLEIENSQKPAPIDTVVDATRVPDWYGGGSLQDGGGGLQDVGGDLQDGGGNLNDGGGDPHVRGGDPEVGGGDPQDGGGDLHDGGGDPQDGGGDLHDGGGDPQDGRGDLHDGGGGLQFGRGSQLFGGFGQQDGLCGQQTGGEDSQTETIDRPAPASGVRGTGQADLGIYQDVPCSVYYARDDEDARDVFEIDDIGTGKEYFCKVCRKPFSSFQALGGHSSVHTAKVFSPAAHRFSGSLTVKKVMMDARKGVFHEWSQFLLIFYP
jgi:hypothetical protein